MQTMQGALYGAFASTIASAIKAAEESAKGTRLFKDRSGSSGTRSTIGSSRFGLNGEVHVGGAGRFLENGTKPHDIRAKSGGMLRFVVNGSVRFARVVHHPGTAERPFMSQARDAGLQAAEYGAVYFIDAVTSRI